jgi:hypothetical protein
MSQPKNKFLLGYGIVTALGAGVLGYLWYSASSENETITADLTTKQGQVSKLESAPLFPSDANLTKKATQVDDYTAEVDKLHSALVSYQTPLKDIAAITPDAVSANLGKYKTQLESVAKGRGILIPAPPLGIDLGLGRYLATPPKREATPQIDYLVESVNTLLTDLFRAGITKLDYVSCPERAYEKDDKVLIEKTAMPAKPKTAAKPATKPGKADPKAAVKKEEAPLLDETKVFNRYPVHLTFTGSEKSAQEFLNHISTVGEGGPFWVINSLRVDNSMKDGPTPEPGFQAVPVTNTTGAAPEPNEKVVLNDVKFVLGNEKVTVTLDLDLVRFLDPSIAKADTSK